VAATEWAAKGVQLGSPINSGATKLVSTKTLASGEHEGSWENQECDVHGPCMDQASGTFCGDGKVSQCRRSNRGLLTGYDWLVRFVNAPIDVVGAGVKAVSPTALKWGSCEPAEDRCPGADTIRSSWIILCRSTVSEKPAMASKSSAQGAAAT
jgi:hypothetical protein